MTSFKQKIAAKLQEKIAEHERTTRCGRVDLRLVDYEMVDPHVAQLAVEYSRERGVPAPSQLNEWVLATFNGSFRVNPGTVRNHPDAGAMTLHVQENQLPLPITRKASMIPVGGGTYMDGEKNQWKIVKGPGGEDILMRAHGSNVEDLLKERINRQKNGRYASVKLDQLRTAGIVDLEVGDTVIYSEPNGGALQKTGVVSAVNAKTVSIKGREGSMDRSYVMDIVDKNAGAKSQRNKEMVDFMTEYYFSGDKSMGNKMKSK
jgi:hypothetical protein